MAVKFTNVQDAIDDNGIKILVHGPAGAGKTKLCATTGVPTLIINAEGGLLSIADAPSYIRVATIENIHDLYEVYNLLLANPGDFEWVMLDSISEIAEVVLSNEKAISKDPRQAYGELQEQLTKLLRAFRDLPDYNVMMTCKQAYTKDDYTGITMFGPSLPGRRLPQEIPYLFDEVFALRAEKNNEGVIVRSLQTFRDMQYDAKDRSGALNAYEEPNLQIVRSKIQSHVKARKEEAEQAVTSSENTAESAEEGNQE